MSSHPASGRPPTPPDDELGEYAEAVLDVVDQVPPGSVTTYGRIARVLAEAGLGGGPRSVGAVMSAHGGAVAWWRVLPADGSAPVCDPSRALARWRDEGTPLRGGTAEVGAAGRAGRSGRRPRVDLARAVVEPTAPDWVHEAEGPR